MLYGEAMVHKSWFAQDEAESSRKRFVHEMKLFTEQDFISEAKRVLDKCHSLMFFLNESISRMRERTECLEQEINRNYYEQENDD
jgi:hypothetical protein